MKITNVYNLPQPLVDAVTSDYQPTPRRYSVTTLLKGTCEIVLSRRHGDEVTRDVSEMIWALFGSACHKVLEQSQEKADELKETKLEYTFDDIGLTVSGIQDLYSESEQKVVDYKTASVNKVIFDDWSDYRRQLLCYAWILNKIGLPCKSGEIVAFLKDWSTMKTKANKDYPKLPVYVKHFEFSEDELNNSGVWIKQKLVKVQETLENVPDSQLLPCLPEERWERPTTYAVMKKGRKTALRVFNDLTDAMKEKRKYDCDANVYIETRKGQSVKCENYCDYSKWCPFYQMKLSKEGNGDA